MNKDLKIQNFSDYLKNNGNLNRLTTNSDNNNAPVHRWFPFFAGFSYRFVNETISYFDMADNGAVIFDPFIGSGTTGVVGKEQGIEVVGNESNLFLYKICKLKTDFQVETTQLTDSARRLLEEAHNKWRQMEIENENSLLKRCYPENNLKKLVALRELIGSASDISDECKQYLFLAITMSLPKSANVGINVPYVSWRYKRKPEEVFLLFEKNIHIIEADLNKIIATYKNNTETKIYMHDTREENKEIKSRSIDMVFTSPPYLNNFDYGEALKVFLYFWKIAKNWGEITKKVRKKAISSSTTYYSESAYLNKMPEEILGHHFMNKIPKVAEEIISKVEQIASERKKKNLKKSFDILTPLYFKDMFLALNEIYRVMKEDALAFIVIGDSAPYGIHIPTDTLLGEMAVELGFSSYTLKPMRNRGIKWKTLKYRHNKELRESLLILVK